MPLPTDISLDDARLYVEVSIHTPEIVMADDATQPELRSRSSASSIAEGSRFRTRVISFNTYNPRWSETLKLRFNTHHSMLDLCFLRVELKNQIAVSDDVTLAHFCGSLGSLESGKSQTNNIHVIFAKSCDQVGDIFLYMTNKCRNFCTPRC